MICVHYCDGNGRVGRLWHTLLLSKWNPAFIWLPVESIIHANQQDYYAAINTSNEVGESTVFIEFMLSAIKTSLIEVINVSDEMSDALTDKTSIRWRNIEDYLKTHPFIMNKDVRDLCRVSAATANRILAGLVEEGNLSSTARMDIGRINCMQIWNPNKNVYFLGNHGIHRFTFLQ